MTLPVTKGPQFFGDGIAVHNDSRHFLPVSILDLGIKERRQVTKSCSSKVVMSPPMDPSSSTHSPFDRVLADLPSGEKSLAWDRRVDGWITLARDELRPTGSLRVFGSLRCFMATADRFKCVHEPAVPFYGAETPWRDIYKDVQTTPDPTARAVRRLAAQPARHTPQRRQSG